MQLSRNAKTAFTAFIVFDLLVAAWLIYLFLLRSEVNEINDLRELGATRYPEPTAIESFTLLDDDGDPFTQQKLLGKWSLVFFGFTSCPDVCPLTMTELAQFYRRYSESGAENSPQIVFISVDTERDGIAELSEYMSRFDDSFVGLSGPAYETKRVAESFFVAYSSDSENSEHMGHMTPSSQNDDYMVSHSVHLSVVNPAGELHSVIRPPIRSEIMLELYPQLILD